ncbi:hypothetical protein KC19_1G296300 [Ceratodon purpureus]|uniref:Uncharacterized protein n=1 Tax=Ceratodon purpureus TaxID=3225 RepID=A0A8T0JD70_CERPU|nr:hypothetical protein KC19_1G296300 [Ceratodon purpureus]
MLSPRKHLDFLYHLVRILGSHSICTFSLFAASSSTEVSSMIQFSSNLVDASFCDQLFRKRVGRVVIASRLCKESFRGIDGIVPVGFCCLGISGEAASYGKITSNRKCASVMFWRDAVCN